MNVEHRTCIHISFGFLSYIFCLFLLPIWTVRCTLAEQSPNRIQQNTLFEHDHQFFSFFPPFLYSEYLTLKSHISKYIFDVFYTLFTCISMHRRNNNNFVQMKLKVVRENHSICAIKLVASWQAAKYITNSRNSIQTSFNWIRNNVSMMMKKMRQSLTGNDDT